MNYAVIKEYLKEALDSYKEYIKYSGVLKTDGAKLALLKWPDIAIAAIDYIDSDHQRDAEKADHHAKLLEADLKIAITEPIKIILQSYCDTIRQKHGKVPSEIKSSTAESTNPIEIKKFYQDKIRIAQNHLAGTL